jgi:putative transposase
MARQAKHTDVFSVWQQAAQEGDDGLRRLVERVVQEVLETESTRFLEAEPYERTREGRGYRQGYKPRLLKTRVAPSGSGPRTGKGSFRRSGLRATSGPRKRGCWPSRRCSWKG